MSLRGKGVVFALLCAFLAVVVAIPAEAKQKEPKPQVTSVKGDTGASYSAIFDGGENSTQASCSMSCGDGTGFICTGSVVSCTDGFGCSASGGGVTKYGFCEAT
jgi:hypothetical protein